MAPRRNRQAPLSRALKLGNVISFLIVAFGQSAWIPLLGPLAAACGYALFWRTLQERRFWPATIWFTAVQLVQISWLATPDYMPPILFLVYALLAFAMGLQFGLITRLIDRPLALAGGWVLFEWSRLFLFTGFPWNPVGLSLAANHYSIQFASLFGVYGLSFWVILVNALALRKTWTPWAICALLPYVFGFVQEQIVPPAREHLSVALVQPGLLPDEKMPLREHLDQFIPALQQWERICQILKPTKPIELIVFPEAAFPLGVHGAYYHQRAVASLWKKCFESELPPVECTKMSNGQIAQQLAEHFGAQVIIGFDDYELKHSYNAAFLFSPHAQTPERYEKRMLVPGGEYIPAIAAQFASTHFGIQSSFEAGNKPKLFSSRVPIGISICSDEVYSGVIRELRVQGAELLVSISNDGWYPRSRLARQHFEHGRLRAAENGVPLLRSCNTGITGAIDCFGNAIATLPEGDQLKDILYLDLPLRSFPTLYSWWGDRAILLLSLICLLLL